MSRERIGRGVGDESIELHLMFRLNEGPIVIVKTIHYILSYIHKTQQRMK